jgi:DNA polymerase III subunit gamma/tau
MVGPMLSLYRRHRPRTFDEVVGQEHIVRTLRNAIELDKVHHAYLFVGSRGTGKTSTAKLLACALNAAGGPNADFDADDPSAQAIRAGTSLDVVEMDAASNNSVDDIRELRENVSLAPMQGGYRVYILDEAHMLSAAAWNAFLKTLEEPPAHVVFVLATTEAHKVPATIVDRCHRFDFHRPSLEQVAGVLRRVAAQEGIEVPDPAIGMLARSATGSFRDALGTLEQLVTYGGQQVKLEDVLDILGVADAELVLDTAEALADRNPRDALLCVQRLSDSGRDFTQFMRDLSAHLRHLFVVQTLGEVPDSFSVTAEHTDRLAAQAERLPQGEIVRAVELLASAISAVKDGSEPRIQLELALLKATQPQADLSVQALMARMEQLELQLVQAAAPAASSPAAVAPAAEQPASAPVAAGGEPLVPTTAPAPPPAPAPAQGEPHGPVPAAGPEGEDEAPVPTAPTAGEPHTPAPPAEPAGAGPQVAEPATAAAPNGSAAPAVAHQQGAGSSPLLDLEQLRTLWPAVAEAVREENGMLGAVLGDAKPIAVEGERLTLAFPASASFAKKKAEQGRQLVERALHGLTGRGVVVAYELTEEAAPAEPITLSEEELIERLKSELAAEEVFDDEPELKE